MKTRFVYLKIAEKKKAAKPGADSNVKNATCNYTLIVIKVITSSSNFVIIIGKLFYFENVFTKDRNGNLPFSYINHEISSQEQFCYYFVENGLDKGKCIVQ